MIAAVGALLEHAPVGRLDDDAEAVENADVAGVVDELDHGVRTSDVDGQSGCGGMLTPFWSNTSPPTVTVLWISVARVQTAWPPQAFSAREAVGESWPAERTAGLQTRTR